MVKHSIHCRSYRGTGVPFANSDCDCGAMIGSPEGEVERLRAIVDKLPKTADGVPVVPGRDMVWVDTGVVGIRRSQVVDISGWAGFGDSCGCCRSRRTTECYSTRDAAEAAREK